MIELFQAIVNRFNSDDGATLRALLTGGLHNTHAPQKTPMPYGVFSLTSAVPGGTFTERSEDAIITFDLFSGDSSALPVCEAYVALNNLFNETAFDVPGGWRLTWATCESNRLLPYDEEDRSWHYSADYRFSIEKDKE